jgi:hypothetical protein
MQYVDHMDDLLEALLSREVLTEDAGHCRHCDKGMISVWRCKDCSLGTSMCRRCMRISHRDNPFHRIERWNDSFFTPAELWEVGTYILVRHHTGPPLCEDLQLQTEFLEAVETIKDKAEQDKLANPALISAPIPAPHTVGTDAPPYDDVEMNHVETDEGDTGDEEFIQHLQDLRDNPFIEPNNLEDGDENTPDEDTPILNPYLPAETNAGIESGYLGADQQSDKAKHSPFGTYLRVVHTNGIHNIAMISCHCRGCDSLPLDLLAARLLPTSFQKIRTLFTAQLLDTYRLCNLELKASAYQFYQLLRRLTQPMAPAEVIDLYREFQRMSRIWRWMKRLKWGGYGSKGQTVKEVDAGTLAVFCPACPQPGINISNDWMDDPAR